MDEMGKARKSGDSELYTTLYNRYHDFNKTNGDEAQARLSDNIAKMGPAGNAEIQPPAEATGTAVPKDFFLHQKLGRCLWLRDLAEVVVALSSPI